MDHSSDTPEELAYFRYHFETGGLDVNETDFNAVRTQLHNAAYNNCIRIAEFLLRKNADASIVAERGYTPLHVAASRKHDFMLGIILKYSRRDKVKKFIDAKTDDYGYTALHLAAKNNRYEAVRLLLSYGANFEVKDKCGKMAIQLTTLEDVRRLLGSVAEMSRAAKEAKSADNVKALQFRLAMLHQFEYMAISFARNHQGYTQLQVAIHSNYLPTVQAIEAMRIERLEPEFLLPGMVKKLSEKITKYYGVALYRLGRLEKESMSESEALKDGYNVLCHTWMIIQAFQEYQDTLKEPLNEPHIKFLEEVLEVLEFHPDHYDDKSASFVTKAEDARYYKMLKGENTADRKSFVDLVEMTICVPMMPLLKSIHSINFLAAIKGNDLEAVKKLYATNKNHTDVNIRDNDERRPLHVAVAKGNLQIVQFLLNNDKVNMLIATENDNETALHVAVEIGHFDIVKLLLYKCDVDKVNDYVNAKLKSSGATALHVAAAKGQLNIVKILLEYHAIYCVRDEKKRLPKDLSTNDKIVNLFKFIDELFDDAKNGKIEILEKMKKLDCDLLLAVGNACDKKGYSVAQVASLNKHRNIGCEIFKMVVEAKKSKHA